MLFCFVFIRQWTLDKQQNISGNFNFKGPIQTMNLSWEEQMVSELNMLPFGIAAGTYLPIFRMSLQKQPPKNLLNLGRLSDWVHVSSDIGSVPQISPIYKLPNLQTVVKTDFFLVYSLLAWRGPRVYLASALNFEHKGVYGEIFRKGRIFLSPSSLIG